MPRRPRYTFVFAPEVIDHLDVIERKHHTALQQAIEQQLTFTPEEKARNRKPLEQPAPYSAAWELRCGRNNRFRVMYDVDAQDRIVSILAIGVKDRNRLFFGREEYQP